MRIPLPLGAAVLLAASLAIPAAVDAQEQQNPPSDPALETVERREAREAENRRIEREAEERLQRRLGQRVDESVRRGVGIQVRRIAGTSIIAILHDIDLEPEFLMVRLRFWNDGTERAHLVVDPAAVYESFFVEVNGEKRFILETASGLDAKRRLEIDLRPDAMASWWARFPPLPADAEYFHVVIPPVPPFLNVPVTAD